MAIGLWKLKKFIFEIVSKFTSCLFLKPKCLRIIFLLLGNNTKLIIACTVFWISRFRLSRGCVGTKYVGIKME